MKILNLYAGLGGNRKLWVGVKVTAVEIDSQIAAIYQEQFPDDIVVVADAHQYLLEHHREFDLIWSSPPCPSHSSFRQNICVRFRGTAAIYPDMRLYQEIIFLQHNAKCLWVVENVKPYYKPLVKANALQRHLFWSNFDIEPFGDEPGTKIRTAQIPQLQLATGFDLAKYRIKNKRQLLRNCVDPALGMHVLKNAMQCFLSLAGIKAGMKNLNTSS